MTRTGKKSNHDKNLLGRDDSDMKRSPTIGRDPRHEKESNHRKGSTRTEKEVQP